MWLKASNNVDFKGTAVAFWWCFDGSSSILEKLERGLGYDDRLTMVRSAEKFVVWNDFPKGLKVLLLMEKDESSALETKSKLEEMDYKVSLYHNEEDAWRQLQSRLTASMMPLWR